MKVYKIFGCILSLHLSVIIILLVQSGCLSTQAPTQIYTQESSTTSSDTPVSEDLISITGIRFGDGLDAAFNAGYEASESGADGEYEKDIGEDRVAPLEPIVAESQTVEIVGASFENYTVIQGDSLWSIAKRYNITVDELYATNDLVENTLLRIGQKIQVPVDGSTADVLSVSADSYQPTSLNEGTTSYVVKRGDTLSSIAKEYDSTVREIKAVNSKASDLIRVGETLILPAGGTSTPATSPNTTSTASEEIDGTNNTPMATGVRTHTVKAGDIPSIIARQYGMTVEELLSINGVTDPRKLQIGKVLKVGGTNSPNVVPVSDAVSVSVPETIEIELPPEQENEPVELKTVQSDPQIEGAASITEADNRLEGAIEVPVERVVD